MRNILADFLKINNRIYRNTQAYLDKSLHTYGLGSGSVVYLLTLMHMPGISQTQLSQTIGNDKAMSARTIGRLVEQNLVRREPDPKDSRACRLYLTDAATEFIPVLKDNIHQLIATITEDLTDEEAEVLMNALRKVHRRTQQIKE